MCGITGFFDSSKKMSAQQLRSTVEQMSDQLRTRGPDSHGTWVDHRDGIAFGHRRLAVIDLSAEGYQPMHSACGRYVIVFNGEIYNHKSLSIELRRAGEGFRGHSDTEVMLAAISKWGIQEALQKFNGMFAFALWDRNEKILHLCRDRLGEKPLYYGWRGKTFLFGSELKALSAHPDFHSEIDRNALALYMRHNYIPAPHTIYRDIYKLPAGSILEIRPSDPTACLIPTSYWSFAEVAQKGIDHPFEASEPEALDQLETLLKDAVQNRMEADVPLGAFLSGGIDSSVIVALMQEFTSDPIKTFTIGFHEEDYNEAKEAKAIARHLGTEHTELYVTPAEAMAVIPMLPSIYNEPFSDVSQIPTYLVSKLARKEVTVSLSGDGGDELFGGYPRYFVGQAICNGINWIPHLGRRTASKGLEMLSELPLQSAFKLQRMSDILSVESEEMMYREMISHVNHPNDVVIGASEPPNIFSDPSEWLSSPSMIQKMMFLDTRTYLPDDVLVKLDRASMAVGLETRVPFLDHRVVTFAWQLPIAMHVKEKEGKRLLRKILSKYVPIALTERPKMGFGVPIGNWLREPLRDWGESLLDEKRLVEQGFFDPTFIRKKWENHLKGKEDRHYLLWTVLMFQAWLEENNHDRAQLVVDA